MMSYILESEEGGAWASAKVGAQEKTRRAIANWDKKRIKAWGVGERSDEAYEIPMTNSVQN